MNERNMIEFKFVSSNGGIRYLAIDRDKGVYSTDYFANNGGHRSCNMVSLKTFKERLEEVSKDTRYKQVTII